MQKERENAPPRFSTPLDYDSNSPTRRPGPLGISVRNWYLASALPASPSWLNAEHSFSLTLSPALFFCLSLSFRQQPKPKRQDSRCRSRAASPVIVISIISTFISHSRLVCWLCFFRISFSCSHRAFCFGRNATGNFFILSERFFTVILMVWKSLDGDVK